MLRSELDRVEGIRFTPETPTGDGILVLAGSSGRIDEDRAAVFAGEGNVAESIRWFGGPGQHSGPWEIPIEIFLDRVDDLKRECDRVWVIGTSFGSEAAMLTGAFSANVTGVVAFAPADVVWAGYDERGRRTSHWTKGGVILPYVPFDFDGFVNESPSRFRPLYEKSRETFTELVPAATIPTERIERLLLIAGGDDQVWPSVHHAERIRSHRAITGLETQVISETDAGHRTILPGESFVRAGAAMRRGGSEQADRRLGAQAWEAIRALFDAATN